MKKQIYEFNPLKFISKYYKRFWYRRQFNAQPEADKAAYRLYEIDPDSLIKKGKL